MAPYLSWLPFLVNWLYSFFSYVMSLILVLNLHFLSSTIKHFIFFFTLYFFFFFHFYAHSYRKPAYDTAHIHLLKARAARYFPFFSLSLSLIATCHLAATNKYETFYLTIVVWAYFNPIMQKAEFCPI